MTKEEFQKLLHTSPAVEYQFNGEEKLVLYPCTFGIYPKDDLWFYYSFGGRNEFREKPFKTKEDAYDYIVRIHELPRKIVSSNNEDNSQPINDSDEPCM